MSAGAVPRVVEVKAFVPAKDFALSIDALAWWTCVQAQRLTERYAVQTTPPTERPWGMVDFTLTDPSGVLWRIAHNIPRRG